MTLVDLFTAALARARRPLPPGPQVAREAATATALGPVGSICRVFFAHDYDPAGRCRDCGQRKGQP